MMQTTPNADLRTVAAIRRDIRRAYDVRKLLTESAKTLKSEDVNVLTGILYITPASEWACPSATDACRAACLGHSAGRMVMGTVRRAQRNRLRLVRDMHRDTAHLGWSLLRAEIGALVRKAERLGMIPAVRLNGTSDLAWYDLAPMQALQTEFPTVRWYDYTKRLDLLRWNYSADLTLSATEAHSDAELAELVRRGARVAVVFRGDVSGLTQWQGLPVVNGDAHDARFLEPGGVFVALSAKGGKMRRDASGFVRELPAH